MDCLKVTISISSVFRHPFAIASTYSFSPWEREKQLSQFPCCSVAKRCKNSTKFKSISRCTAEKMTNSLQHPNTIQYQSFYKQSVSNSRYNSMQQLLFSWNSTFLICLPRWTSIKTNTLLHFINTKRQSSLSFLRMYGPRRQFQADVHCNNNILLKTARGFSHVCDSGPITDFFVQTLCQILQQNTRNKWPYKWKCVHKTSRRDFWWLKSWLGYLANDNSLLSLEFTVQTPGHL